MLDAALETCGVYLAAIPTHDEAAVEAVVYAYEQIESGKREEADVSHLLETSRRHALRYLS